MNKHDLLKILPNEKDIHNMYCEADRMRPTDKTTYEKAQKDIMDFLLSKVTSFTEVELLAIDEYKSNKLEAVKFLMKENNWGLKQTKDFLDANTK